MGATRGSVHPSQRATGGTDKLHEMDNERFLVPP